MRVLTVTGSASTVETVADAVKTLDVPPPPTKDVELTAYFLVAKRQASQADDLPPALKPVVAELRNVLNYQSFSLLNTALIRAHDGAGSRVDGVAGDGTLVADFSLRLNRLNVEPGEKGATVHIHDLDFVLTSKESKPEGKSDETKPSPSPTSLARIETDIDVPVGQKVVVGKTAFGSADNALILVLTAKVTD
jgi:hypothetical protein